MQPTQKTAYVSLGCLLILFLVWMFVNENIVKRDDAIESEMKPIWKQETKGLRFRLISISIRVNAIYGEKKNIVTLKWNKFGKIWIVYEIIE